MSGHPSSLILIVCFVFPSLMHGGPTGRPDVRLATVPMAFEANAGQYRSGIKFGARMPGGTISLSSRGATIAMKGGGSPWTIIPVGGPRAPAIEGLEETKGNRTIS